MQKVRADSYSGWNSGARATTECLLLRLASGFIRSLWMVSDRRVTNFKLCAGRVLSLIHISLEEYRRLWRDGALVIQSAGRYMYLAETKGLSVEAISVGETAFARFKDPSFLLSAMEIAYQSGRYTEVERLIGQAHAHIELFAENRHYYLMLADYYTHQGKYAAAQASYLKLLTLDPQSVMTLSLIHIF